MTESEAHGSADSGDTVPPVTVTSGISEPKNTPAAPATPSRSPTTVAQSLTDRVLTFLSHASNETLGACLAGLGAATYLVLGRVGLLFIGLAGGVVLQATWEGIRKDTRDEATKKAEAERRREVGLEVIKRILDLRAGSSTELRAADSKVYASQSLTFSEFGPETETALNAFTDAVIKDYVHYWYDPTIPGEESFPASCRRVLTAFLLSLSGHLKRKRAADVLLDFVTNSSSIIIVFLTELSAALNASPNTPAEEAIFTYVQLKPDSSLSYMLDQDAQTVKLAEVSEEILQAYLDPKAYNCPPVHTFLREVLAQLILGSTVTLCSRPDWINDWIVYGLEESQTTKEVMGMVDAGVEGKPLPIPTEATTERPREEVTRKDSAPSEKKTTDHKRTRSKAELAMEEAMEEARRLTELMIAEDERRAREEKEQAAAAAAVSTGEDVPDAAPQSIPASTSSQSDLTKLDSKEETTASPAASESQSPQQQFTSFEQLVPTTQPTALITDSTEKLSEETEKSQREPITWTLHKATVAIFDDSVPGEKASIKAKPTTDYLIQIEPAGSVVAGWMIARKYADFETLHEILRRISVITGVNFTHTELPPWRTNTKANLRVELEKYLCDAMRLQPLAESEGMKRFLEKDRGLTKSPGGASKGFGWPTPDAFGKIGGDMMNVLTKAPKQVAGSGKAVFGGVAGLVGAGKKANGSSTNVARNGSATSPEKSQAFSTPTKERTSMSGPSLTDSYLGSMSARESQDSLRAPTTATSSERRGSATTVASIDSRVQPPETPKRTQSILSQQHNGTPTSSSPSSSVAQLQQKDLSFEAAMNLPPPPSEMPEDYASPTSASKRSIDLMQSSLTESQLKDSPMSDDAVPPALPKRAPADTKSASAPVEQSVSPITERETAVAVELMFAVITQLYTLSSAWNIRRTLLSAAKAFLLRPGNPQLLSIRDLLQASLLDANLSDAGLAQQIYTLRKNGLPTAEELEIWNRDYPEKTDEQKVEVKIKARRLLVTKGMPPALTSVMGAAASGEALGKVFDSLQVPAVSRGLVFGLMLQALRVVTH